MADTDFRDDREDRRDRGSYRGGNNKRRRDGQWKGEALWCPCPDIGLPVLTRSSQMTAATTTAVMTAVDPSDVEMTIRHAADTKNRLSLSFAASCSTSQAPRSCHRTKRLRLQSILANTLMTSVFVRTFLTCSCNCKRFPILGSMLSRAPANHTSPPLQHHRAAIQDPLHRSRRFLQQRCQTRHHDRGHEARWRPRSRGAQCWRVEGL